MSHMFQQQEFVMDNKPAKQPATKQKRVEPTCHFATENIKIGDDYTTDTVQVTEFVLADQLLANFPDFQKSAAMGYGKAVLELGDHVHLAEDDESILATVPGYPTIKKIPSPEGSGLITVVAIEPLFHVSEDNMKVSINIHPALDDCKALQNEDIDKLLADQNIVYGINSEALENAKEFIVSGEREFRKIVVAKGQPVGESKDAYLRFELEIGPIAGTILEDGSIDFRDRRIMVGIKAGECIATKIPPVQGKPGIDIYGEETAAPEGKDLKVELLNDAKFSPETMQITANRDGVLSVVNNNVIKVCSHQVITGDVDYETGNVDSMSSITIQGSVQPGFKITAGADLKIVGSVMSTIIKCAGNLVVNGGITGKNSRLEAGGDADINFIEMGTLQCGGLVVIRKQSYYSDIYATSDIRCRETSKIMGGQLIAEGNVSLGDVGSENSTPSLIAAGVVAERLNNLQQIKDSVVEQQDAIIQWLQLYRGSSSSKKIKLMEQKLAETKIQLLRINLIPGSGIYSRAAGPADKIPADGEDYNSEGGIPIEKIKIDVKGTIFAATEIHLGNRKLKLEKTVSNRQFKLHPNGKSIIAGPIKR
jgi:uncharacterized protein (DUF342 family)